VAGGERKQADLVIAGGVVALQRGPDDRLDGAVAERPLDDRALAEPALPGAATHDLDGDPVVGRLDEGDDRPGGERSAGRVADHAGLDLLRDILAGAPDLEDRAILAVDRLVDPRDVGPLHLSGDPRQLLDARQARALHAGPEPADDRQAGLA